MNYLKLQLFAMLAIASVSHAQVGSESLSAEVDAEIDRMYSAPSAPTIQSTQPQQIQTVIVAPRQSSVQKQPITMVEASPLSASNADSIRKNRQDEEMRTETRIVEKLEISRMEDEKRRAQVLFGDKFDALNNKDQAAPAPIHAAPVQEAAPVVAPTSHIQAQPIIIQANDSLTRDDVVQEVRAALDEDKAAANEDTSTSLFEKKYFSAQAGIPQYADSQAIRGNYSAGVGIGTQNDYLQVEGGFVYSNYNLDAFYYNQFYQISYAPFLMNQYQTYLSAKFQIMGGAIRPNLGGLVSYSYRTYVTDAFTSFGPAGTKTGSSGAIDLGITAGVDIALNERFALGADFKYMFNMSANIDGDTVAGADSPEKLNYYLLGVAAKMSF
jgi:hypothetical protein